ncbi:hypothetical protein SEPCBS57363_005670 [Sporothrix epigloea]|uniref:Uncharacterized protein n=1 Tax=Sporothrix epigloea TaxID=1892477 RepID=A0ABP0DZ74_9PEZI
MQSDLQMALIKPQDSEKKSTSNSGPSPVPYQPSLRDVVAVKALVQRYTRFPLELVDAIMDEAAYWAHSRVAVSTVGGQHPDRFALRTPPLGFERFPIRGDYLARKKYTEQVPEPIPAEEAAAGGECSVDDIRGWLPAGQAPARDYPCRKIIFTIVSRDQGRTVDGRIPHRPYQGSYSWFDVGLERYGWQGEHAQQVVSGRASLATKSFQTSPLRALAPDSAVLYTIRPGIVARPPRPPPPPPLPGDWNYRAWWRLNRPGRKPQAKPPVPRWMFDFPPEPGDDRIQSNRVAWWNCTTHTVAWSWNDKKPAPVLALPQYAFFEEFCAALKKGRTACALDDVGRGSDTGDGSFVRNLRVGDVVTVWAKSRHNVWENVVRSIAVDVYWAV